MMVSSIRSVSNKMNNKTSKYFAKRYPLRNQKTTATVATLAAAAAAAVVSPFAAESPTQMPSRSSSLRQQSNSRAARTAAIPAVVSPSSSLSTNNQAGSDHGSLPSSKSTKPATTSKRKRGATQKNATAKKLKTKATSSSCLLKQVPRTESFSAIWAGSFPDDETLQKVKPHTLILGTHPSITSLERQQYFGHNLNAFWWIAGDCLGFRRDSGISSSSGKPYQFTSFIRHDNILSYDEQLRCFVRNGFCLWDVVASCHRPGSLDQDIHNEEPNRIREFCQQQTSIKRIVLANGGTSSALMKKHFHDWFLSGELVAGSNPESQKLFGPLIAKARKNNNKSSDNEQQRQQIQVISAISVSPAAAKLTYEQKRDFWEEHVYRPGLMDMPTKKRL